MEELLQDVFKEATGPKLAPLRKACQDALEALCLQESNARRPCYELRRICLLPLQIALESKRPRLVTFAIQGFHKMLRDDRFHRGIEPEDDSLWMPSQLFCATASVMYHLPETQVQIFRMYLSLALSPRRTLNGRLCVWACGRCGEAAAATAPVAAAARAAAAQALRAYCAQLDEEYQELFSEGSPLGKNHIVAVSCYSEVIPVIQYLCSRLSETQMVPKQNPLALFFLDCLLTLMSSLSERVSSNSHFTTFLWQKFCPSLISFLGTPRVDKNIKSREHEGHLVDDSGRGSGALNSAPSFNSRQAKTIYSIANQLVRLVGSTSNLRPVLEALYHRMLLYPPVAHRVEPLRSVRELLHSPKRLIQLVLLKKMDHPERHSDDMAIVRLIMDGIEDCGRTGNPEVIAAAVECVVSLLDALEKLCISSGEYMTADVATLVLQHWPKLQDADYSGPLTYQTLARLPSPYRDVVAVLQNSEEKGHDSSDTSGPENVTSGSDGEADSDADNVFLPTRANNPSSSEESEKENVSKVKLVPKTLNLGRCTVTECNVDLERHNARQFVKTLQNSLLPKLINLRTCIEVDEAMQEFASKCCQHNAAQPPATACIMNADGVYLATYAALLLNLRQRRTDYYTGNDKLQVSMTEDEFVDEVQGSGVLVYLSATWLREVYQQVLSNDLLKNVPSTEHPLLHLLSDLGGLDQNPVMSDWQKLKEVSMLYSNTDESPQHQASLRWTRRILTCIWESMVTVLSVPLTCHKNRKQKLQGILSKKINSFGRRKRIAWEALTIQCLEGLHKAARVSNTLSLQNRCSSILALLAHSAISQPPNGKILSTHALSLDILITGGLELGSKAPECWEHIFAACQYVSSFEHTLFGQQGNNATPIITMQTARNKTVSVLQTDAKLPLDGRDDETCTTKYITQSASKRCRRRTLVHGKTIFSLNIARELIILELFSFLSSVLLKIKEDPEKYVEQEAKERARYLKRKEQKKIKDAQEMTPRQLRAQRKKWRVNSKSHYERKKKEKAIQQLLLENSPPNSDTEVLPAADQDPLDRPALNIPRPFFDCMDRDTCQQCLKKDILLRKFRYRHKKEIGILKLELEKTKKQKDALRKTFYRIMKNKTKKENISTEEKIEHLIENVNTEKREEIKKKLVFGEILSRSIGEGYKSLRKKDKKEFSNIVIVDVFNFLQPVLETNMNNEMSVSKIVETCRQEVHSHPTFNAL
ncbi:unnamed protein product [Diatraea saccharalis]|uniref:SEC7 domain-containing protein n=1 Tax=Diatraea saccharalis TaxID=40085 RepID=A0A9N9WDQ6_9NEOP|nr:unnamed protein product [Diatraea saccharalis]